MEKTLQAGGIVFRVDQGEPHFLLVRARRNPSHWIFPKGHIEPRETPERTAVREVEEESGVRSDLLKHVGAVDFDLDGEPIHVDYFLLRYLADRGAGEGREARWCTYDEALRLLTFESSKDLLRNALVCLETDGAIERRSGIKTSDETR